MSTSTLGTQAMQVGISFGLPRQSKELKDEAAKIIAANHAQHGTIGTNMYYFKRRNGNKKIDGLDSLKKFQGRMKAALEHYARYPYTAGSRILPAGVVAPFMQVLQGFKAEEPAVWMHWADDEYPEWWETGPARMGNLFDEDDYPSLADCRKRFRCDVMVVPIGEVEQVQRISMLSQDVSALITSTADAAMKKVAAEVAAQNWSDVMKPIQKIVEQLSKDKTKLHDCLIENIVSIVDLIPAINLGGDARLAELARVAKEQLCSISIEDLRESAAIKAQALAAATNIINTFTPYARKFGE